MSQTCTPGESGVPDTFIADLLCGNLAPDPQAWWDWAAGHTDALFSVAATIVALRLAWATVRIAAVSRHSSGATWWEITPPVSATPATTLALWRLLAPLLPRPRPWTLVPARLAWEVHANRDRTRCGLWVPPGVSPAGVRQAAQRAWPGARVEAAPPPRLPRDGRLSALRMATRRPVWAPLVDEHVADPSPRHGGSELDVARAVYDAIAAAGRGGGFGLLQVVISRAPATHVAALRRAGRDPARVHHTLPEARMAMLLVRGVAAAVRTVLDLFAPGCHTAHNHQQHHQRRDPHLAEEARQARARLAAGPLFLVAVRAAATGATYTKARSAADDITAGFGLHSPHFHRRRLPLARQAIRARWATAPQLRLATAAEAAALARVPFEPSLFGLPAAAARRRAPAVGGWATTAPPPGIF